MRTAPLGREVHPSTPVGPVRPPDRVPAPAPPPPPRWREWLPVGFRSGTPTYLGPEELTRGPYAEATQQLIDEEVAELRRQAEERATATLSAHRRALDRVVELLLERGTIDGADIDEILRRPPERDLAAVGETATRI